jgi:hypothetical protein
MHDTTGDHTTAADLPDDSQLMQPLCHILAQGTDLYSPSAAPRPARSPPPPPAPYRTARVQSRHLDYGPRTPCQLTSILVLDWALDLFGALLTHDVSVHPTEQGFVLGPTGCQAPERRTGVKLIGQAHHLRHAAIGSQHREELL